MVREQLDVFLKGPQIARIATVGEGNSPYVVPVWYEWDGKNVIIVARKRSAWVDHIRVNPKVAVLVDEDRPPYRKVLIQGEAQIVSSDWIEIGRRMVTRYLGAEVGPSYLEGSKDQPRWVIIVKPTRIVSWFIPPGGEGGKDAWHHRYYEPGTRWYEAHTQRKSLSR